jgi:four helix bundle protein
MKRYLCLKDISAYRLAYPLSNEVWDIVQKWDYFAQKTVGRQFVESVDSISANIAEGFSRYYAKDKIRFYYFSRGSVGEALDWIEKAKDRRLLSEEQYRNIRLRLSELPKELNNLINFTRNNLTI